MNKVEQQRVHFENISEKYYRSRQSANHILVKKLIWGSFFKDKDFLKGKQLRVLEPMCGYAEGKKILETHLNSEIDYRGFDYSQPLIDLVKRNNPAIKIEKRDVTTFSFEQTDEKYDVIILIGGLHHVFSNADRVVEKLSKALKNGGYFINFEPTQNFLIIKKIREFIYKKNSLFDASTEQGFDLPLLNNIFINNEFEILDQIYPGLISYILFYNPDAFPFLNVGGASAVGALFSIDKLFFRNFLGRKFSFATLSIWRKKTPRSKNNCYINNSNSSLNSASV